MQPKYLTRFLVGGTTLALLNASISLPVAAKHLVALGHNGGTSQSGSASSGNAANSKGAANETDKSNFGNAGSGQLLAMANSGKQLGQCPLKHTDVQADISGYVARVTVKQTFQNPFKDKIEAVYTFPLSENGAVDEMVMKIGGRTIKGSIKKREEAREIYDQARANGQAASLLDQERTNIFTQSVANIEPGKEIEITIKYVETLPYEAGKYSFVFPTVVGPRFNPGSSIGKSGTGRAEDTTMVPDASKITPPVAPQGERAGHDISINVHLNAGMAISQLASKLHQVDVSNKGTTEANIALVDKATIPNKDFVLSWNVAQDSLKSGILTYKDPKDAAGYFTLMMVPPKRVTPAQVAPKEMIFVIDCSGSQSGLPLDKAKETMRYILEHMNANDTFQVLAFNSNTQLSSPKPLPNTAENKKKALQFINSLEANGGTWMAPAVEAVCSAPQDEHRLRIVTFMTDGYVGNDYEILGMIKKYRGKSRWFSFGTGNSVNRTLIDGMAKEGGGEAEYVLLNSSAEEVGHKFYDRISSPVLTDVELKIDGVPTKEVYPREISDVWAEKPLYFKGKYLKSGAASITISGFAGGKPYHEKLNVNFPESNTANEGIASMWARAKVDRLMSEDWFGAQSGKPNKELKDEIVATALEHHIMTQYTSFVAVDDLKTKGNSSKTVAVPTDLPDGVSREGALGGSAPASRALGMASASSVPMVAGKAPALKRGMPFFRSTGDYKQMQLQSAQHSAGPFGNLGFGAGGSATGYVANAIPVAAPYNGPAPAQTKTFARTEADSAKLSLDKNKDQLMSVSNGRRRLVEGESKAKEELSDDERQTNEKKAAGHDVKRDESKPKTNLSNKLSASLKAALKNTQKASAITNSKGELLIALSVRNNADAEKLVTLLKAMGLEVVSTSANGHLVKAYLPTSKIDEIAAKEFVLHLTLASDRK